MNDAEALQQIELSILNEEREIKNLLEIIKGVQSADNVSIGDEFTIEIRINRIKEKSLKSHSSQLRELLREMESLLPLHSVNS